jgi:hypothetical protein
LTERSDALAFAAVLTVAAATLPNSFPLAAVWRGPLAGVPGLTWPVTRALALLTLGLALALPDPSRSGLTLGLRGLRSHWRGVLLVCGLPVLATAAVFERGEHGEQRGPPGAQLGGHGAGRVERGELGGHRWASRW